jgi:hypothetical protein
MREALPFILHDRQPDLHRGWLPRKVPLSERRFLTRPYAAAGERLDQGAEVGGEEAEGLILLDPLGSLQRGVRQ